MFATGHGANNNGMPDLVRLLIMCQSRCYSVRIYPNLLANISDYRRGRNQVVFVSDQIKVSPYGEQSLSNNQS